MAAGLLFFPGRMPSFDRDGDACVGYLRFFENQTMTPKPVYSASDLTTPLAQPIASDSSGNFPLIWADAGTDIAPNLFTALWFTEDPDAQSQAVDDIRPSGAIVVGPTGDKGWSPVIANIPDGERRVQAVVGWVGGEGDEPSEGGYITTTGYSAMIADATDIRGPGGIGTGNVNTLGSVTAGRLVRYVDVTGDLIEDAGVSLSGLVPVGRTVTGGGLATGGGDLSANRVVTVTGSTGSDIRAGTSTTTAVTPDAMFDSVEFVSLTDGATITPDFSSMLNAKVTLGGNRTLANPTTPKEGQSGVIRVIQDGTGGRTLAYGTAWKFDGGAPTLSTAAGSVDMIAYIVVDETTPVLNCTLSKGFA